MTFQSSCPFCSLPENCVIQSNAVGVVVRDAYPVSPGHTLLIPFRHVASFFELTSEEREGLLLLMVSAKQQLQDEFSPAAYNIGINDGLAAGQTIAHMHLHLIPRYQGDVSDPRGGVRWVLPEKAKYWP